MQRDVFTLGVERISDATGISIDDRRTKVYWDTCRYWSDSEFSKVCDTLAGSWTERRFPPLAEFKRCKSSMTIQKASSEKFNGIKGNSEEWAAYYKVIMEIFKYHVKHRQIEIDGEIITLNGINRDGVKGSVEIEEWYRKGCNATWSPILDHFLKRSIQHTQKDNDDLKVFCEKYLEVMKIKTRDNQPLRLI